MHSHIIQVLPYTKWKREDSSNPSHNFTRFSIQIRLNGKPNLKWETGYSNEDITSEILFAYVIGFMSDKSVTYMDNWDPEKTSF
jgi:hypothetical protein